MPTTPSVDELMRLADNYAHVYAFVGDDSMPIARAALRAALEAAVPRWLPIEQAPRDGTKVDLWMVDESGRQWREADAYFVTATLEEGSRFTAEGKALSHCVVRDGWWAPNHDYDGADGWCDTPRWFNEHPRQRRWIEVKATHYMPIPAAPAIDAALPTTPTPKAP